MPWQYTHGEPHPELVRPDGPAHGNRGACPCDVRKGIPSVVGVAPQAALGGALLAYGPSRPDLDRLVAVYIDRVLRGARPSELPVEQVWKHDLVINRKTAKALGLTIPPSLLARADQVIE